MSILNSLYYYIPFRQLAQYKEYMICLISFSKFSVVLHAFTCAGAIGNLWGICLGVNILIAFSWVDFNGNVPLLKALKSNSLLS